MSQFKIISLVILSASFLSGCAQNQIFKDRYEDAYLEAYEASRNSRTYEGGTFKLVQPKNKEEPCKLNVYYYPEDNKTLHSEFDLSWDGECKDGLAHGLGREVEISKGSHIEQIGYYEKGKAKDYCSLTTLNDNTIETGECGYDPKVGDYLSRTIVKDLESEDFEVYVESGINLNQEDFPMLFTRVYLFHDIIEYWKVYPNFCYTIIDHTNDKSVEKKMDYYMKDFNTGKMNGYAFTSYKTGEISAGELNQGEVLNTNPLPSEFYEKVGKLKKEIEQHATKAQNAYKIAMSKKLEYLGKVCSGEAKIEVLLNNDIREMCSREYNLSKRIKDKLKTIKKAAENPRS
ncbi:MAG: hypothetical protein P8163_12615 [Candidatus Thiodiazotropha sp.]